MSNRKKPSPLLFVLVLGALFIGVSGWGLSCLVENMEEYADQECADLCTALNHKKIKMTDLGCVCEDPETGKRHVHGGGAMTSTNPALEQY